MAASGHLGYRNGTILVILNVSLRCLPLSFGSILLMVCEEMSFEEFQDGRRGGHLGYRNGTVLASFGSMAAILEWKVFSNSESPCHCDASHQVSAQSDTVWKEMSFEEFQDGRHGGRLEYRNGTILAILNFHVATMPSTKFKLNPTYGSGGDIENVKNLRRTMES